MFPILDNIVYKQEKTGKGVVWIMGTTVKLTILGKIVGKTVRKKTAAYASVLLWYSYLVSPVCQNIFVHMNTNTMQ